MTIFGVRWEDLCLADLARFLADAEPEPLLWEAKGIEAKPGEVRRQVCGFANSHDGGYLIIGASQGADGSWTLDGVEFNDEPPTWIANVVADGGVTPYPEGLDTRTFPTSDDKWVVVVRVPPTPTPPCNARGTVYERVSGRTISVKEPTRLAQLFGRGDQARRDAHAKADVAAREVLLVGRGLQRYRPPRMQFGLGLAAPGYLPGINSRLFSLEFEECVGATIDAIDHGPMIAGGPALDAEVLQDARVFMSEGRENLLGWSWAVRATWHGAVGVYWVGGVDQAFIDSTVNKPVRAAWTAAEAILDGLAPQGPRYLEVVVAGGPFPPNGPGPASPRGYQPPPATVIGRGPLTPGVHETVLTSIERELRRATGEMAYEEAPADGE